MPDSNALAPFSVRLADAIAATGAPLCVGLDPDPDRMPPSLSGPEGVIEFCVAIAESTSPMAAAFKPNLAFFEALPDGWALLEVVCEAVRETGRLLVLDGKRGDIGNTGRRYAAALYDRLGGDAATVAPYMGADSIAPFVEHAGRCAFVLVATSNPGAADLQHLDVDGRPLYRRVADLAAEVGAERAGDVGFVVGATRPALLEDLREAHPDVPFLVPGVGAQGGSVGEVLAANAGGPLLVNASRSILYASAGPDYARAAGEAAERLAETLRR
ncbi:orotidine-5'-phosphate decarboxylase [Rubrivirga sp.]|uniref:orotidine-5'-phosphate decarboxylase n=1 Tax=Rubrivirga sp. TaxID=1885344 RepID=UPI003B51BDFC